jgi:hypothetical protein
MEMTQYARPRPNQSVTADGLKICAHCGRQVSADDLFCAGCGIAFDGAPAPVDRKSALPGFQYHLMQGLGWGLGFTLAAAIVSLILYALASVLVALAFHGVR